MPAAACVNTFESEILRYQAEGDEAGVAGEMVKLESDYEKNPSLEHTNDLAVGRLLTRRYADAIELLNDAEMRFPGKAIVATNLGTAHELSGNLAEALRWISEGVRRDPKEHYGTEWLHVMILQARMELARDANWLASHTVLGVSFGDVGLPNMPAALPADAEGRTRTPEEIGTAVAYQLGERTKFVNPPDPIVADLYAAQGDLAYAGGKPRSFENYYGSPPDFYEAALNYGPVNKDLVERRRRHFDASYPSMTWTSEARVEPDVHQSQSRSTVEPVVHQSPWRGTVWPWFVLAGVLVVGGAAMVVRRRSLRKP